jgi:putative oxidoreductase
MVDTLRRKGTPVMLTVLRLVLGLIMTVHGWMKLTGVSEWKSNVAAMGLPAPEVMAPLAVAGELLGGLGLMVGLLTPIAALGTAATMVTAILAVHLPHGLLAKNNGFEYPLTLLAASLFFVVRGAGPISVDAWLVRLGGGRDSAPEAIEHDRDAAGRETPEAGLRQREGERHRGRSAA